MIFFVIFGSENQKVSHALAEYYNGIVEEKGRLILELALCKFREKFLIS